MMTARTILLRRPPVIQWEDSVFLPPGADMDEVDRRWQNLCAANPAYFDGAACHVLGVHRNGCGGATIHLAECAYRFFAVQDDDLDLGVRPLGVKGITGRTSGAGAGAGAEDEVLFGRRSSAVAHYQHCWEFAPGGTVEPGEDPAEVVIRELQEETTLQPDAPPRAVAIMYDDSLRCWELVYRLSVESEAMPRPSPEYTALAWHPPGHAPTPRSPIAEQMLTLLAATDGEVSGI